MSDGFALIAVGARDRLLKIRLLPDERLAITSSAVADERPRVHSSE